MGFFLFLLVNAVLFIRPSEIVIELATVRIYEALIIGCFAFSFLNVVEQFTLKALETRPITLGVLAMLVLSGLSHVIQSDMPMALESFVKFFKVVVYYLLLVGVVNTPSRLRWFLLWLGLCVTVLTAIAVLRYHEIITITPPPTIQRKSLSNKDLYGRVDDGTAASVKDEYLDPRTGDMVTIERLRGTGIFNDPNDLSLALTFGIFLCLYGLSETSLGMWRWASLAPLGLFVYALRSTSSRGGLLAFLCGLVVLFACRFGWRKTMFLGAMMLPLVAVAFGGRMTSISAQEGTAQTRLESWRDGLVLLKESPVFGVGMDKFASHMTLEAHNSFLHAFSELGLTGGIIFLGMFFFAFWALLQIRQTYILEAGMRTLLPFLMAIIVAFSAGIFLLSRCYEVPTYTMLGLVTAYLRVVPTYPVREFRIDGPLVFRSLGISFVFLACIYLMVNALVQ